LACFDAANKGRWRRGPPSRSRSFRIELLIMAYQLGRHPRTVLRLPHQQCCLGSQLLFRTIEIGAIRCNDVTLDVVARRAIMRVSTSKSDPEARGARIRWQCTCGLGRFGDLNVHNAQNWMTCVFHLTLFLAVSLHEFDERVDTPRRVGAEDLFFKTSTGTAFSPVSIARWLTALNEIMRLGDVDDNPEGTTFGGHSLRRAGAQHWCRRGMVREILKALGRWRSSSIDDYLGNCLTEDLGLHSLQAASSSSMSLGTVARDAPVAELVRDINELKRLVAEFVAKRDVEGTEAPRRPRRRPQSSLAMPLQPPAQRVKLLVYAGSSVARRKLHRIEVMCGPNTEWRCKCGFHFGRGSKVEVHETDQIDSTLTASHNCSVCTSGCFTVSELQILI